MRYTIRVSHRVKKIVEGMDWKSLIDQMCCPQISADKTPDKEYGALYFHPSPRKSLKERISAYRKICKIPPLVTTDMESGPGNMITDGTRFPSMMACGKCNDESLVYEMGRIAAVEGRDVGFNWSLAPCVDIARDSDNPIVGVRSAGSDADLVIKITVAYARGMQENGIAATAKHFPGDGFSKYDQHLTTSVNSLSMVEWREQSGRVFKALIDAGVMTIMPGHIALPAYDVEDEFIGCCPPATISRPLMVDLLRGELGFEGMIVSDAVNMGGMVNFMNYYDACATFWANGGDCLLFPKMDENFYMEMEKRLESGMLSLDILKDRAGRIIALKEQMGLFDEDSEQAVEPDFTAHQEVAKKVASGAIEVVRDRSGLLPFNLTENSKVLHVIVSNSYESHKKNIDYLSDLLSGRSSSCKIMVDPGPDAIFDEVYGGSYDLVICSTGCQVAYGVSSVRVFGSIARNMMHGWMRLDTPVIFVNHFTPGVEREFDASIDTLVNTCRSTHDSIDALMKVIFK